MGVGPDNLVGIESTRFSDIRRLGDGAEGGTWLATDPGGSSSRRVVLKRVPRGRVQTVARAFEVLRHASSPHLPTALELIPDGEGGAWLVTGFVEGRALEACGVGLEEALSEALGVAHALAAIHGMGSHHGDVSANNVIVTPTRGVVLTDLGQLGSFGCGTPGFLAPEVLRGGGGPRADRFALGCLLCLRVFGRVPWHRPERVLAVAGSRDVRARLRALAEAAEVDLPGPVEALLERLLDPDPERRVADPGALVARLRQLQRAVSSGASLRSDAAPSAWWVPNNWRFRGPRESLEAAASAIEDGRCRVVAVAGPAGSGRGRVVEEIVGRLQVARTRDPSRRALARISDFDGLARDILGDAAAGGSPSWVTAWVGGGGPGDPETDARRVWGLRDAPRWPERLAESVELQAAVLRAGAGLGADVLMLPVSLALGRDLAAHAGAEVRVLELPRWSVEVVAASLAEVVEGADAARVGGWAAAIHAATGGWPAKVIRAIEACARTGEDNPDRAAVERALVVDDAEPRMDPELARRVLDRRWGLSASLPEGLTAGGEPLASAVAAARAGLGEAVPALARATLSQLRAAATAAVDDGPGRGSVGRVTLALALDADDADAVEACALDPSADLPSDWIDWLEAGGALRVGPRLRLRALRQLIRGGQAERALTLLEAIAATGSPSPAEGLEGVRAREQLGRPNEAIAAVDALVSRLHGPDLDRALGLRWRAMVDAGHASEAREAAERWARGQTDVAPDWRRAVAWLWGGLARLYAGGEAGPWLDRATDACAGEHGPGTARIIAGLRARIFQLEANLAQMAGEGERARTRYRAAAEAFAAAGEGLGRILVEGSLAGMAYDAGEYGEALERGRAAVRGFLARAQVQTLPAVTFNVVGALVGVGALDEGRRLHTLVSEMCAAAASAGGGASALSRARLNRVGLLLEAAQAPTRADARGRWRSEIAASLTDCARALADAGAQVEAADAHLQAAALLRVGGQASAAAAALASARAWADPRDCEAAGSPASDQLAVVLGVALETLAQVPVAWSPGEPGPSLSDASGALGRLPGPAALERLGQRQLAWLYDRTMLSVLHRHGHAGEAGAASVARRLVHKLEHFMSEAPPLDRRALRQSLLSEAGEAGPLRELVQEIEAAERGLALDPQAGPPAVQAGPSGIVEHRDPPTARAWEPSAEQGAAVGVRRASTSEDAARMHQLLRIFRRLAREDELEGLLEQIVEAMMELTHAERGVVCVGQGDARIEVAREIAWTEGRAAVDFSRSVIEQVLAGGEPVLSVDAASDDRFDGSRSISHLNLRSVLAVPLVFRGELLGAAYVDHRLRRGHFDATDLAHMEDFADLAALAVAQARAIAEVRQQAATLELQRAELAELLASREVEVVNLREAARAAPERSSYRGMVGSSKPMQGVFRLVDRLADSAVPVVIYGESGTGKELVARALHDAGSRSGGPFVAENCGAIPETLLESVLFGHARGAFTGAQSARPGLFEAADGGTIFLDEIGETSPNMQTKLLRVLQEGEVRRLGETKARKVDVRVIAASNRSLESMVAEGSFRQDLYYRINVVKLELPALRDRREDIPALIEHFLERYGPRAKGAASGDGEAASLEVSVSALRKLTQYAWPGNIRELENEVRRWLVLCEDRVMPANLSPAIEGSEAEAEDPDDLELRPRVDRLERRLIARAMERSAGNQTRAALLLGLSRYGLQKKLKRMAETDR